MLPETTVVKLGGSARQKGRSRSLLWPRVYDALRRQGHSKSKAAAISNAHWNKYRRWGRAGQPGPKSMAARIAQRRRNRLRKSLGMADVHINHVLDNFSWSDEWEDTYTDAEIEEIAREAAQVWELDEHGEVIEKQSVRILKRRRELGWIEKRELGTKPNSSGGQQPYDERGRYTGTKVGGAPYAPSRSEHTGEPKFWSEMSHDEQREADHIFRAWDDMTASSQYREDPQKAFPERYVDRRESNPKAMAGMVLRKGEVETRYRRLDDGRVELFDMTPGEGSVDAIPKGAKWEMSGGEGGRFLVEVPTSRRPLDYVYRMVSEDEFAGAMRRGYFQSDQRMNLANEGTVMSIGSTGSFYSSKEQGSRIVRIRYDPATMRMDKADSYIKTSERIPIDLVEEVSGPILLPDTVEKGQLGTKINGGGAQQPYDEFGRYTSGGRISTVPPKGKVGGQPRPHHPDDIRRMGIEQALSDDSTIGAKWLDKLSQVAGFGDLKPAKKANADEVSAKLDDAINRMKDNILDIHDRADPKDAAQWGEWYPIANKLGEKWAREAGVHPDTVYAIMARLSPQTDWNDNMTMAREMVRILADNPTITAETLTAHRTMQLKQAEVDGVKPDPPLSKSLIGKKLSDLDDLTAGKMVRAVSDVKGQLRVIDHEENPMNRKDGEPRYARWQKDDNLMRSVSLFRDGSFANVTKMMGTQHKIRAFYNNIREPHDTVYDDVTVDTHAFGIAMGIPVTTASTEISNAKGSITLPGTPTSTKAGTVGVYPLFAEAYRRAGKERGMLGRQMQSITWEQWRKEWSPRARNEWMVNTARNVQEAVGRGELSRSESWKILKEFRDQLPQETGGGTNQPDKITGRIREYLDGKVDKHQGPGPHQSGTPQDVHGGGGGVAGSTGDKVHADYGEQLKRVQAIFEDKETFKTYAAKYDTSKTHIDETGNWTPERRKLHREILAEAMADYAGAKAERRAIFTGGLGGAGKTRQLQQRAAELGLEWDDKGNRPKNYVLVSADDMKERLAAKGAGPKVPGLTPAEASVFTHEEGSYLSKRLADLATTQGKNVIWDYTMGSIKANEQRARPLVGQGYKVKALFVDVSAEQSIKGATKRHESGHTEYTAGKDPFGGRYVPTWARATQATGEWKSGSREAFENWKDRPYVSGYKVIDNENFQGKLIEDKWGAW